MCLCSTRAPSPHATHARSRERASVQGALQRPAHALVVTDDLAQCAGARHRGSDIGAVSFYPTKTLVAGGDGGLVLTDDPDTAKAVKLLTHHGMATTDHAVASGRIAASTP